MSSQVQPQIHRQGWGTLRRFQAMISKTTDTECVVIGVILVKKSYSMFAYKECLMSEKIILVH